MGDLLAAVLLLTAQPGQYEPLPTEEAFPAIRDGVHQIAVQWEILDTRETSYIFHSLSSFQSDLDLLRRRRLDFAGCPPVSECGKFPDRYVCNRIIEGNRLERCELLQRRDLERDRQELFESRIVELDSEYRILDACRDAWADMYYITVRRHALRRLRDTLGEENYQMGLLPGWAP